MVHPMQQARRERIEQVKGIYREERVKISDPQLLWKLSSNVVGRVMSELSVSNLLAKAYVKIALIVVENS